jgi:hypothetical protein
MSSAVNRQVLLVNRPSGEPKESDFRLVESPVPEPGKGQFLCRTIYLSLDPYMRGRMSAAASYAKPAELNQPMVGGTVSQVVRSQHPDFCEGDLVLGYNCRRAARILRVCAAFGPTSQRQPVGSPRPSWCSATTELTPYSAPVTARCSQTAYECPLQGIILASAVKARHTHLHSGKLEVLPVWARIS